MRRRFATLDVFTERRYAGNPLAVVLDAERLDAATMQAIAREFGHPETVFVFPPEDAGQRARLRIFTPARELAFAGHPTVGTAVLLALRDGAAPGAELVLAEGIGPVWCRLEAAGEDRGKARFRLPQLPLEIGRGPDRTAIAAALGLSAPDIGLGPLLPSCWSAGLAFTIVPVGSLAAVRACRPDPGRMAEAVGDGAVYVITDETIEPGHAFHARMFAPGFGVAEDPATGAAAAAFAGLLAAGRGLSDGEHSLTIEQGYEMGRPSLIRLVLQMAGGALWSASIAGAAVVVSEGTLAA